MIATLPIQLDIVQKTSMDNNEQLIIDMSNPSFPTGNDMQVTSSIIFIRNTGLQAKFNFSKCSYEIKEEYLLTYMTKYFKVSIYELASTWVKILSKKYGSADCMSILDDTEIDMFINKHNDIIEELLNITGSIPIYVIKAYFIMNEIDDSGLNDIDESEYCGINGWNYFQLLDVDNFIQLIQIIDDVTPKYYSNYFVVNNPITEKVVNKLPYFLLLDVIFKTNQGEKNTLLDRIDSIINP